MVRRYSYQISYLDKGRYPRNVNGIVLATTLRAATQRAVADGRKKAKGWKEAEGSAFSISILIGPKVAEKEDGHGTS